MHKQKEHKKNTCKWYQCLVPNIATTYNIGKKTSKLGNHLEEYEENKLKKAVRNKSFYNHSTKDFKHVW